MATVYWNGDHTDGTYSHADNWLGDAAPVSTDTAIFPALAPSADIDVTGGDMGAILHAALAVEDGCYVNFGSRGVHLEIDTDLFEYAGSGKGFFTIVNCAETRITNASGAASGYSYGLHIQGGVAETNALLLIDAGNSVDIGLAAFAEATAEFTTIVVSSGNVEIGSSMTCTSLYVNGGVVKCKSDITNVYANGGKLYVLKNNPTTLYIENGARVYYNSPT
ncbi:MAG TPA: hypothetical protein VNA25_17835, partial [Phycisphaerae bacterium]|nr:hypothetical protein [Phycisphaerae bacterium]